jgi:mono/diheme cytochrome c family protein
MKLHAWIAMSLALAACAGCKHPSAPMGLHPTAAGAALVESSGGTQLGNPGAVLAQPLVVQVNDKQGNSVTGALVNFSGPADVVFNPAQALTDSSGQVSTQVTLGGIAGRYELTASSLDSAGKPLVLKIKELAAGYQQQLGFGLDQKYCARCHDPESTSLRVSNYDNLEVKPHAFTEGEVLNKLSDSDLLAIIGHGGPALSRSPLMPPFGATLNISEIQALVAFIRLVSEPPYKLPGTVYGKQ